MPKRLAPLAITLESLLDDLKESNKAYLQTDQDS